MQERKYYEDSYTTIFEANIVDHLSYHGNPSVVLDQTYFYPTSGGQPNDLGRIDQVPVIDVLVRPEDGAIVHILERELRTGRVSAVIDWARRFDHMQHHTGQHILSQAFIQIAGAQTIGFHLSDSSVTIDLDKKDLSTAEVDDAEQMSNDIIWQNRAVQILEVSPEEALALPLRKIPPTDYGQIRLIDIDDFDLTACGGTHVAFTAEVGLLKVIKHERRGEKTRIEFRCGNRALADYRVKHSIISQLSSQLTTAMTELTPAVSRLQNDLKVARNEKKKLQSTLDNFEAQQLLEQGSQYNGFRLITQVYSDRDIGQVRALGNKLVRSDDAVALFGLAGERSQLLFLKAENAPGSMKELLQAGLQVLGSRSGGGNDTFAQGVGPSASPAQIRQALSTAQSLLLRNLEAHEIE